MKNTLNHVAIIMDGNGRWAQTRGLPRMKGHNAGAKSARSIVEYASRRNIEYITLYAFSSENWKRPSQEVEGLFRLLERFIDNEVSELHKNGVRIHVIGDISKLSPRLRTKIINTVNETASNSAIHLTLALSYGGRDEIVRATKKMLEENLSPDAVSEETISSRLDTSFMPDPDLLIRTGGEKRISNYLLWQIAYSEVYFTDVLWPDFDEEAFTQAIDWFYSRQRRFGMTGDQIEGRITD